jgi:hypothetical protein
MMLDMNIWIPFYYLSAFAAALERGGSAFAEGPPHEPEDKLPRKQCHASICNYMSLAHTLSQIQTEDA